jgi:protein-S-isoprenylcysteine O-methyltransferase Ste14
MRHPRYVEIFVAMLSCSFIANYLAIYFLVLLATVELFLVVLLEEKELRERVRRRV